MIEIREFSKAYDGKILFPNMSLNIQNGDMFVIVGRSGTGKSVFLRHLIGLELPEKGYIKIENIKTTESQFAQIRKKMAMVFQEGALFDFMTVEENIGFYLFMHTKMKIKEIKKKVDETLKLVDLEGINTLYPASLSGGMAKRVSIARSIIYNPSYLLYDEPTTGLDPVTSENIVNLIKMIHESRQMTTIIITHDMKLASDLGDKLLVLPGNGEYIFISDRNKIKNSVKDIEKLIGGDNV